MPASDPRYPIGPFQFGLPVAANERPLLLSQLAEAPAKLRAALADLSTAQLDTPYRAGGWTVRQVVHHLPDSHLNWYIRAKLALTEQEPTILPFAEDVWTEPPDGRAGAIEPSLGILEGIHARTVLFFNALASQDWMRKPHHRTAQAHGMDRPGERLTVLEVFAGFRGEARGGGRSQLLRQNF
jgi:DinB superfamily